MVTANQRANTQLSASQEERSSWEHRGTTTIPARLVAKIAAEAANESANVGSNAGGVLGIGTSVNSTAR